MELEVCPRRFTHPARSYLDQNDRHRSPETPRLQFVGAALTLQKQ